MIVLNFFAEQTSNLFKLSKFNILLLATAIILIGLESSEGNTNFTTNTNAISNQTNKTIKGQSGGSVDSQGCGFISERPNYEMSLKQKVDYMRFTVQADGGQPTLLVVGPNSEDSFCVLGDEISGLKPEISGVWEVGYYQIYVGDLVGSKHKYILDISTDN